MAKAQTDVSFPMPWPELRAELARRSVTVTQVCNRAEVSQTYLRAVVTKPSNGPGAERVKVTLQEILSTSPEAA